MSAEFRFINSAAAVPPDTGYFQIDVAPKTDIWRVPHRDDFNAPVLYRSIPVASFRRARLTVSADWERLYDQAGLVLAFPRPDPSEDTTRTPGKWIKAGLEVMDGKPWMSAVATDRLSDWSIRPHRGRSLTLELERTIECGEPSSALWIYAVEDGERTPVRKVTWAFEPGPTEPEGDLWIGAYAARPHAEPGHLSVTFSDVEIITTQEDQD